MNTYIPNTENVKSLGRTYLLENTLWLTLSGSGAAFDFHGTKASVTFLGDSIATKPGYESNLSRIAVYVNGTRVVDDRINEAKKEYVIFESEQAQDCHVEIIKLSEAAMSTVGIQSISADAENGIHPAALKPHYVEFIGDSITCGYGVDDEVIEHTFTTGTEDVTKAYAYLTAMALDADFSFVSLSGYGIISGYIEEGEPKKEDQALPPYYDKLAYSEGEYLGKIPEDVEWDFKRQPDLIVVNLGTNDDSYTQNHPDRQEEYRTAYVDFLKLVRSKNPHAKILCTLGIMGDRLFPVIEKAVEAYSTETQDRNIATMKFDEQLPEDGYTVDWHPTAATHKKAASKLAAKVRELLY